YFAHGTALMPASAAISAHSSVLWMSMAPAIVLIRTGRSRSGLFSLKCGGETVPPSIDGSPSALMRDGVLASSAMPIADRRTGCHRACSGITPGADTNAATDTAGSSATKLAPLIEIGRAHV